MDGTVVTVLVGIVTILVGGGLGYGFAAVRYLTELHTANREKLELQQKLAAAPMRGASGNAPATSADQTQPAAAKHTPSTEQGPQPVAMATKTDSAATPSPSTAAAQSPANANSIVNSAASASRAAAATGDAPPTAKAKSAAKSNPAAPSVAPQTTVAESSDLPETAGWLKLISETAARAQSDILCIVDVDFLRQYRERYGQEMGDYVSGHVEQILRDSLHEFGAVISRYEGQEFIITWQAELGAAAKRLRAARTATAKLRADVERAFLQVGSERLTLTVSLGLALCDGGLTAEQVIARADEALAAAKRAGRNRGYYHNGETCLPVEPLDAPEQSKQDDNAKQLTKRRSASGVRERRRHERQACSNINLIAPCTDGVLPAMDKFQRVQFFDISVSGFSMLVRSVPTSNQFAVALINEKGLIFMAAEVANIRQAKRERAHDKPLLIVGCRFRQRLYPANETTSASMTSALVGAR